MEKMNYRVIQANLLRSRIEKYAFLIESLQAYLPIAESKSLSTIEQTLKDLKETHQSKLDKKYFLTQTKQQRLSILNDKLIEKLEQKYYWKTRAIKQKTKIVLNSKDSIKIHEAQLIEIASLGQIKTQKEEALKRLESSKELNKPLFKMSDYQKLKDTLSQKWILTQNTLKSKHQTFMLSLESKTEKKVKRYSQNLSNLQNKLHGLESKMLFDESKKLEELKEKLASNPSHLDTIDYLESKLKMRDDKNQTHLSISHLSMSFSGLKAVDNLSFDVKKGSIFGLIGPNGAGKTTVFNCITQFYKPTSGAIYFKNNKQEVISLLDYPVHEIIKQGIVRTFQNVELIWELNILENMLVGAHTLYKSNLFTQLLHLPMLKREEEVICAKAIKILDSLGLLQYKDFYPLGLPYGILKKIELARTLMTDPQLIILDEPAAGLNDQETRGLAKTIKQIQKQYGCTIFLVEHDMELVMDICDEICAINFGRKIAIGTPKEIQNHPQVREAYLGGE